MAIKHVKFERTGGFAGIRLAADVEVSDLPNEQADQLRELVNSLNFDKLPENLMGSHAIPDGFTYSITIAAEEYEHSVTTTDGAFPENMQPLLNILNQIAIQQARKK